MKTTLYIILTLLLMSCNTSDDIITPNAQLVPVQYQVIGTKGVLFEVEYKHGTNDTETITFDDTEFNIITYSIASNTGIKVTSLNQPDCDVDINIKLHFGIDDPYYSNTSGVCINELNL